MLVPMTTQLLFGLLTVLVIMIPTGWFAVIAAAHVTRWTFDRIERTRFYRYLRG
jgi:hypothetical protein